MRGGFNPTNFAHSSRGLGGSMGRTDITITPDERGGYRVRVEPKHTKLSLIVSVIFLIIFISIGILVYNRTSEFHARFEENRNIAREGMLKPTQFEPLSRLTPSQPDSVSFGNSGDDTYHVVTN